MVFVEKDSFRTLRRLPTDAFRSIPRLPREDLVLPVAASDLVAWYPFRAGTGVDVTAGDSNFGDTTDYSAVVNGATFKPSGGVTDIQTGANSGAFDLDGTDDTLNLGTVADSDQSFTVMTWIKPDTVSKKAMRILTKAPAGTKPDGQIFLITDFNTGDIPVLTITNNGSNTRAKDTTVSLTANSYSHLAGRYDFQNGTASLFKDGQPVSSKSVGQLAALSSQPWVIGEQKPRAGTFFDGTVDGTRFYTASLSDSQINQIYLNTKP